MTKKICIEYNSATEDNELDQKIRDIRARANDEVANLLNEAQDTEELRKEYFPKIRTEANKVLKKYERVNLMFLTSKIFFGLNTSAGDAPMVAKLIRDFFSLNSFAAKVQLMGVPVNADSNEMNKKLYIHTRGPQGGISRTVKSKTPSDFI